MQSTEYPPLPGIFDVPKHLVGPWATAQTHIWVILLYLDGLDSYIHAPELTAGPSKPVPKPDTPPCMCRYSLRQVSGTAGTHALNPHRHGWHRGVYAFRIHPECPHHGETRRDGVHLVEGGGLYEYVLDDQERRGR